MKYLPKVKICGITNIEDAMDACAFGADALGFRIRPRLSRESAKKIIEKLPPFVTPVLLVRESDSRVSDEIVEATKELGVSTLQLYLPFTENLVEEIRAAIPGVKIIGALAVQNRDAINKALELQRIVNAVLLDSRNPNTGALGGTGFTHDWAVSREIVLRLQVPVILAGGLNLENVSRAIREVQPWGVDCESGVEISDGKKDRNKLKTFIDEVKTSRGNYVD